jgi:hypothetical protein
MEPQPWPEPAAEIAQVVKAKYRGREVPLPVAVRDRFGELFADAEFARAFAVTGPRGWSPGRLALVTVFQMAEKLTDRQAAEAVRDRLSWAYALGLDLADDGFDHTVLCEFRSRVVAHHLEEKVLDLLLVRLKEMVRDAENYVRAGHAACWYSWSMPPSRSRRRMSSWSSWPGSVSG